MPLYEYECEDCQQRFEVIKQTGDDPVEDCPRCGEPAQKLFSGFEVDLTEKGVDEVGWPFSAMRRSPINRDLTYNVVVAKRPMLTL